MRILLADCLLIWLHAAKVGITDRDPEIAGVFLEPLGQPFSKAASNIECSCWWQVHIFTFNSCISKAGLKGNAWGHPNRRHIVLSLPVIAMPRTSLPFCSLLYMLEVSFEGLEKAVAGASVLAAIAAALTTWQVPRSNLLPAWALTSCTMPLDRAAGRACEQGSTCVAFCRREATAT